MQGRQVLKHNLLPSVLMATSDASYAVQLLQKLLLQTNLPNLLSAKSKFVTYT